MSNSVSPVPPYGQPLSAPLAHPIDEARGAVQGPASPTLSQRSSDYVDNASTSMGRAMQKAATGLSARAENARGSLDRAGQYLERSRPEDLGRDVTQWVRENPGPAIGIGLGLGFILGRMISR